MEAGTGQVSAGGESSTVSARRGKRVRNPQGQGGRLRSELIAAADRLLSRTGDVEGLALRAVAREAGIATPSIYLHFPGKQELVRAVLERRFAELGASIRAAIEAADGPSAQLQAGCLAYCRFATDQPNAYRVLFGRLPGPDVAEIPASAASDPDASAASPAPGSVAGGPQRVGADVFTSLVDGIAACMRAGLAPPGDPHRIATAVWTALHGIVTLRASIPGFPWPPLRQQVHDVLAGLAGLRHSPAQDRQ